MMHLLLRKSFIFLLLLFPFAIVAQQQKPNIVFFLIDDMGWQDCSLPFWDKTTPQNKIFHTPNMERLAKMGMKFTNGYANPVCTPSRVALMTGMDVPRHHITNWTNVKRDTPTDYPDSILLPPVWNHNGFSPIPGINNTVVATPLPKLLQQAGYETIHVGKAHFAPYGTPASDPRALGFNINIAGTAAGHPGSFLAVDNYRGNPTDTFLAVRGLEKHIKEGEFLTEALTHETLDVLKGNEASKKPFFLYFAHYAIHVPLSKDDRFYQKYIDKGLTDAEAKYAALVEGMDKSLGDLMNYLEKTGKMKNTYIVFMSDNGGLSLSPPRTTPAHLHNQPLRQGKGSIYEGGIRIPLIVAGPGVPSSTVQQQYVGIQDFFPTMLEWAGIKNPSLMQTVDGRTITPYLKNPTAKDDTKILLWHYPNNWTNINLSGTSWASALRKGNYKLVYLHKTSKLELYDLSKDIGEEHDLSQSHPEKLREMALLMTTELKKRKAPMPTYKATRKPIPWPDEALSLINQPRKNILVLYSDDHSYHALGVMGNKDVQTPNLDKLAARGMLFKQAHVMGGHQGAVCIPSRAMLLTGRYVNRLPGDGGFIPDSLVSLPEVLRSKGYTTFHSGKWHSDKAAHHRMFSTGGDIFFGGMHFEKDGGQFHPTVYKFDSTGSYPASRRRISDTFSSQLYAQGAIDFLNSQRSKEHPFFAYVAFTSPHDPRTPPKNFADRYDPEKITLPPNFMPQHPFDNGDMNVRDEQLFRRPLTETMMKKDLTNYYAMITEMDNQVGRILAALERNGLAENTIIVFAGDNGLAVGQHGLLGKQNLYEHSIRVPMIMAGPGIREGSTYDGFNYLSDIAPTLYELLRIPKPKTVEGISHARLFEESTGAPIRSALYNVYGNWNRSYKSSDGYKIILYNVDGSLHTQLFNLKEDPWETRDLSTLAMYEEKIKLMRSALKAEMKRTHDDLDIDLPDWGRGSKRKGRGS